VRGYLDAIMHIAKQREHWISGKRCNLVFPSFLGILNAELQC
jgi:hypothetical protein